MTSSVVYTVYLMTTIVYITTVHDRQRNGQMAGFHTGFFSGGGGGGGGEELYENSKNSNY